MPQRNTDHRNDQSGLSEGRSGGSSSNSTLDTQKVIACNWARQRGVARTILEEDGMKYRFEDLPSRVELGPEVAIEMNSDVWKDFPDMDDYWTIFEDDKRLALATKDWTLRQKPDLVIVWNDIQAAEVGMIWAARELGIPSIQITHTAMATLYPGNFNNDMLSDYMIGTWHLKRAYEEMGQNINVIPTGLPDLDIWSRVDRDILKVAMRKELELSVSGPVVTWVGTWATGKRLWETDEALSFQGFAQAARAAQLLIPTLQFNVCPHPANKQLPSTWYAEEMEAAGITTQWQIVTDNTEKCVTSSDLVIGARTTLFALALLKQIPCIMIDQKPWFEREWFNNTGIYRARTQREMEFLLTRLLSNNQAIDAARRECITGEQIFAGADDGKASIRAARAIEAIINGETIGEECYSTPATIT